LSWKRSSVNIQTSRHCHTPLPLDYSTWTSLKSLGILRRSRGCRGGQSKIDDRKTFSIKVHISQRNSHVSERCSRRLNIHHRPQNTRSTSMVGLSTQRQNNFNKVNYSNLVVPLRTPFNPQVSNKTNFCILNARSICNKCLLLNEFVVENEIEILCLTETWLKSNNSNDQLIINELTPTGFLFHHVPRNNGRGGGVGILYKKSLKLKKISVKRFKSFEVMGMSIQSTPACISIFVIYKPPPSTRNKFSNKMFFDEFQVFLEQFLSGSNSFFLVGDFNFHVEDTTNAAALQFLNILDCFNLRQHVNEATYQGKHVLDLLITRHDEHIIDNIVVRDPAISDHSAVFCKLLVKKQPFEKIVTKCRKLKSIDVESFSKDINSSTLLTFSDHEDISDLINQYESVLASTLDHHAPIKERVVTLRPCEPWYTEDIKAEKAKRRRLERKWRETRLTVDRQIYVEQCNLVRDLSKTTKNEFFADLISENKFNQKILFSTFKKLSNMKSDPIFPTSSSADQLANSFADFFEEKIQTIQAGFDEDNDCESLYSSLDPQHDTPGFCNYLSDFQEISADDLYKICQPLANKSCELDPIPSCILRTCLKSLLPIITKIVNLSLSSAIVPLGLKKAIVRPILKKQNMSPEEFSSFRPVSNLKFISKVIERVVAFQLLEHIDNNSLSEIFQSAYKKHHSVETALLRVHNDILRAMDEHRSVILVLLDLSAAFDTVNHDILLHRMKTRFGVSGLALAWFQSYLSNRCFSVSVQGGFSTCRMSKYGVPQGSVLGPILFLMYTSPIGDILRSSGIDFHLYADIFHLKHHLYLK